jgi:AraC-like DNA-binding protein
MYEPSFNSFPIKTSDIKYALVYDKSYHTPDDPSLDPSHLHSGYEFYLNLSGDVCFLVNNKFYPISKGDVIVCKPNDLHICVYNSSCIHEHFCLWIECDENSPVLEFASTIANNRFTFTEKNKNKLIEILFTLNKSSNDLEKSALLLSFLSIFSAENNLEIDKSESTLPADMQKILDFIDVNFAQIRNVNDISDRYFISTATLNRWFKKFLQISPREFLEAKKLSFAKKLLSDGFSVNNACIKSGFSDCSYFISVFKKKFGETPLKFCRKNN